MDRIELVMSDGKTVVLHGATITRRAECFEVTYEQAELRTEVKVASGTAKLNLENFARVMRGERG